MIFVLVKMYLSHVQQKREEREMFCVHKRRCFLMVLRLRLLEEIKKRVTTEGQGQTRHGSCILKAQLVGQLGQGLIYKCVFNYQLRAFHIFIVHSNYNSCHVARVYYYFIFDKKQTTTKKLTTFRFSFHSAS